MMPIYPTFLDITLRLALTLAAGAMIGIDRGERGHAAGLRTTMLVCLAASVSMIQMNLLLPTSGKTPASFGVMDMMRLPLGILSGIGFIGAGAILRKGDALSGVTTAATLWLVTVIGLCFGGGQIWLGLASTGFGWMILIAMKRVDEMIERERRAYLVIDGGDVADIDSSLTVILREEQFRAHLVGADRNVGSDHVRYHYEVRWKAAHGDNKARVVIDQIDRIPGVKAFSWQGSSNDATIDRA